MSEPLANLSKKLAVFRLVVLSSVVIGLLAFGLVLGPSRIEELFNSLQNNPWAGLLFVLVYVTLTVLMAPGTVNTVAGGALFGFWGGFWLSLFASTLGATLSFFVARRAGQSAVKSLLGARASAVDEWFRSNGLVAVLVLRLLPLVPFNVFNYAAGVTSVKRGQYVVGTAVGIIPGVAVLTAIGSSASEPTGPAFILSLVALAGLIVASSIGARRLRPPNRPQPSPIIDASAGLPNDDA